MYLAMVLLLSLVAAQRTPSISYITQEQIINIGSTVELDCSVQNALDFSIVWQKTTKPDRSDPFFLSTGRALIVKDPRFAVRYVQASSTYSLQIQNIQEADVGVYTCMVVVSVSKKISADVSLSIRRPPVISDNSTQSLLTSEGNSVQMECYASGHPTPTITWRRENNALLPTGW